MTILTEPIPKPTTCVAHAMTARQRIALALDSLHERCCVSRLADQHDVSRKFVYQQRHKAQDALLHAFDPPPPAAGASQEVIFHLPVTKGWLRQFVLAATLVGHSSLRGVCEMLDCLLDLPVSVGWVHAVVKDGIDKARPINGRQDL